ncbi:hypothetical protein E2C01_041365 [Portunus trituberculatus]|uniref:Uncharacterized protein n=1 Tax=Portunus trituberculatus TaxID=210409 RepID=A0A5B7FME5_PORTR|nr:hypothetical protein [Portunus trituberculatus]
MTRARHPLHPSLPPLSLPSPKVKMDQQAEDAVLVEVGDGRGVGKARQMRDGTATTQTASRPTVSSHRGTSRTQLTPPAGVTSDLASLKFLHLYGHPAQFRHLAGRLSRGRACGSQFNVDIKQMLVDLRPDVICNRMK